MNIKRITAAAGIVAISSSLAACASDGSNLNAGGSTSHASGSSSDTSGAGGYGNCKITGEAHSIKVDPVTPGTLTVANSLPSPGWFHGFKPKTIDGGFEYCMAAELAHMAGLDSVTVKNISFATLASGHARGFDLALTEATITPERQKVVDFSVPYYDPTMAVLVPKGSDVTEDNIRSKTCAAQSGTISVDFAKQHVGCTVKVYPDAATINQGLLSGQVDAIVEDLTVALPQAKKTGTLEVVGQYRVDLHNGAIYPKGSPNEKALNQGITVMKKNGTLDRLTKEYLAPAFGVNPQDIPFWSAK